MQSFDLFRFIVNVDFVRIRRSRSDVAISVLLRISFEGLSQSLVSDIQRPDEPP